MMTVAALGGSVQERVEVLEVQQTVSELIVAALLMRQRIVPIAIAINGVSVGMLASDLHSTPEAVDKTQHAARAKLRAQFGLRLNECRSVERVPASKEASWMCA